jgi:hypothetical protein
LQWKRLFEKSRVRTATIGESEKDARVDTVTDESPVRLEPTLGRNVLNDLPKVLVLESGFRDSDALVEALARAGDEVDALRGDGANSVYAGEG